MYHNPTKNRKHNLLVVTSLSVLLPVYTPVQALEFDAGELKGSVDTTLSYGLSWRVQNRDADLIGLANGGNAFSVNGDDGNLNYAEGIVSNAAKATIDAEILYKNFGGFARASAFYDYENEKNDRDKIPLSSAALDSVGSEVELLDAYVWSKFDLGQMPAELRVGEQVISWGESTFIQNGINAINPVHVGSLRVPGAELREALVPVGILSSSIATSANTNVELFYQYRWEETEIDPSGSYFSTSDIAGAGGNLVFLGTGSQADAGTTDLTALGLGQIDNFLAVTRDPTQEAKDSGQYGVAFHLFVPNLNNTEFGFFYLNYHSRLPILSSRTGTNAITADAQFGALVGAGVPVATAAAVAVNTYASTAGYRTEYPEDIKLLGMSFNTQLGTSGIALQGEVSHRNDAPLQIDDVELLFAALSPLTFNNAFDDNQLGIFGSNEQIQGYIQRDITQIQATATKMFGPSFGANEFVLLGEAAVTHVHNMPNKDFLRLEGPGTPTSGNPNHASLPGVIFPFGGGHAGKPSEAAERYPDATSWGYRVAGRLTYNNVIGSVNVIPRFSFQHDVNGISPGPGGNFIQGRKATTIGLGTSYQNSWSTDLSYTRYYGASRYNLINDRDFVAANIKYSF